ncbi:esterase [Candidatus Mycobacterium methanotrophicum]|uniref:RsiV family protein n=1 Tax=Candidatus Mycobacterium methanotrophicum TaxID=2943498 RepID=A0ABY4QMR8_9MYCO|nr:esterase [Candidatus Mycobacterium methanotrophicum]UQX11807.1 RsiV family protein [Candidatus Mycobacterium methanotrophicum]
MRTLIAAALAAAGALLGWAGGPVAAADSACTSMGGDVEGDQVCHVHAANAAYTLDMKFPLDYPDEQALTDYVTQNRDGFVSVAQTSSQTSGARDVPYQMEVTSQQYHSGQPPAGTRSVVLKVFEDLGGPRPSTSYKSFNYDLGSHQPITFDTLFPPNSKPLDAIYPIVQREVGHQAGSGTAILPGSGLDSSHYQNFAITDDELIFYFAPGELLPPAIAGATQAHVPRNAIPPLAIKG